MKRIFTGPSLEAKRLCAELMEIGIRPVERSDHNSSVVGGFTASIPDQVMLFITEEQFEKAAPIINAFMQEQQG